MRTRHENCPTCHEEWNHLTADISYCERCGTIAVGEQHHTPAIVPSARSVLRLTRHRVKTTPMAVPYFDLAEAVGMVNGRHGAPDWLDTANSEDVE